MCGVTRTKRYSILKIVMICVLLCILILLVMFSSQRDVKIYFSAESGYYNDTFELKIIGGGIGDSIYYTLDGSEPGLDDSLYNNKDSILITDVTMNGNVYSARTDLTTAFLDDLVETYSWGNPGYTVPGYCVDKCNVVRASVFDENGNCLDSIVGIYFIGFQDKSGYDEIYTASIVTDPDNLFGYENGIYVTGVTFDNYMKNEFYAEDNEHRQFWQWWSSNYSNRGIESEREAIVTIFDENKELILSEECGIRIQGGGSRGRLPKSIGCYAREIYAGGRKFACDLFHSDIKPHKFVFFSGAEDNIFKLKDYMVNIMGEELAFSTMDFIPCAVFLDGEYWGLYYITENYNSDYVSDHYLVKRDNVILIKNWEITEGKEEDADLFREMREFIIRNDMRIEENYEKACELIDMESYIDYYAMQIYIARWNDWPSSNWAAWRTRENDGSTYGDCKWRWMLFDVNSGSISSDQEEVDTLFNILQSDEMFYSLYLNDAFRAKFTERILYVGNEIFSPDKCEEFLYEWEIKMREPVAVSNQRFYNDRKEDEFNAYVEEIRRFFYGRYDIIRNSLMNNGAMSN